MIRVFFYIKQVAFVKCREVWTALAKRGHASSWNLMLNNPRGPGAPALKPNNPWKPEGFALKSLLNWLPRRARFYEVPT